MTKQYYIPGATYEREVEVLYENGFPINEPAAEVTPASKGFARRDFLKGAGVMVVGFSVAGGASSIVKAETAEAAGGAGAAAGEAGASLLVDPSVTAVDSYIVVSADGSITTFTSAVDLGQGIAQQYVARVAEEMDVSIHRVKVVLGDTGVVPSNGGMSGSGGTNKAGRPIMRAAATARRHLLKLAGERFGVPVEQLTVNDGVVSVITDANKSVSYAELIAGKRFDLTFVNNATTPTKPTSEYKVMRQPLQRADIAGKLTGEQEYVHDVRLPGMLYARSIRPRGQSYRQHSVLENVDMNSVADVKGLVKVVPVGDMVGKQGLGGQNNFVGVICEREEQAIQAAAKLKVTWGTPPAMPEDLYQHLITVGRGNPTPRQNGDMAAALASADKVLEATYRFPFQAHASMGSVCAVGDVKLDKDGKIVSVTVWSSTQNTYGARTSIGTALGIPTAEVPEKVQVIWRWGSGSYGGSNGNPVVAVDAAVISAAVGRPVKVQWFREDTFGWESYGPLHLFNVKAGLDAGGNVVAYDFDSWGASANATSSGERYKFARTPSTFRIIGGNPTGGTFFLTAPLRAPNQPATSFASESFIDELAAAAKADPVQFRLKHLDPTRPVDARTMDVINAAAEKYGWVSRPSPDPANAGNTTGVVRGRGIAYGPRDEAYVAVIIEVEVDQSTGVVRATRSVVAHDIGDVLNPESMRQQIEGNVIQTVSRALYEEITHDGYRVSSLDWAAYPFLVSANVPKVESVLLIHPEEEAGQGAGEATCCGVPAAIGNAIFDATGVRIRQVPLNPERVLAALKSR